MVAATPLWRCIPAEGIIARRHVSCYRVIYVYAIKKVASYVCHGKVLKHVYVTHPKFVDVHAILDGFR
jgi:hypothetical protein